MLKVEIPRGNLHDKYRTLLTHLNKITEMNILLRREKNYWIEQYEVILVTLDENSPTIQKNQEITNIQKLKKCFNDIERMSDNDDNASDATVSVNLESFDFVADMEQTKLKEMEYLDKINQLAGNYKSCNTQTEDISETQYQTQQTFAFSNWGYDTNKPKFIKDDATTLDELSEKRKPHFLSESITPNQESPTLRKPRGLNLYDRNNIEITTSINRLAGNLNDLSNLIKKAKKRIG